MLTNLITNIQKITTQGKQSYFGKRWSATTAFDKQVAREDYKFDDVENTSPIRQLKDQILTSYQNQPREESRHFVTRMRDQSLSFLAERRGLRMQQMQRLARLNEAMNVIVRRLFDILESYSLELNCYMGCTELQTAVTRPQNVREITKFSKSRQPLETITYFRARLATPTWSLIIRGKDDVIEFLLLPVGKVMGLSKCEAAYDPLFRLQATIEDDGELHWTVDDRPLTRMLETEICMEVFTRLIEQTKCQMQLDSELYDYQHV